MTMLVRWAAMGCAAMLLGVGVMAAAGVFSKRSDDPPPPVTPAEKRFRAAGQKADITVYPTLLLKEGNVRVGEVVAMLLERGGMINMDTAEDVFMPSEGADLCKTAQEFAEYIRNHPPKTEYALFTHFMGTRETGFTEVRCVVVAKNGDIVWQDRQAKGDKAFDKLKPNEPLKCCVLVVERLKPVLSIKDLLLSPPPEGKLAQRWRIRSGIPDQAEIAVIEKRSQAFRKDAVKSTMLIYPSHAGNAFSPDSAKAIAAKINEKKLALAVTEEKGPAIEFNRDINQQQVLWTVARRFSEFIKKNPPSTDYALLADYLMGPDAVGGVHVIVCNKQGDIVLVDYQNSHHADFQAIRPKTRDDCDQLVVKRLQALSK